MKRVVIGFMFLSHFHCVLVDKRKQGRRCWMDRLERIY